MDCGGGGGRVYVTFPGLAPTRLLYESTSLGLVREVQSSPSMWMSSGSLTLSMFKPSFSISWASADYSIAHRNMDWLSVCQAILTTYAVHNHWAHGPISPAAHTRPHHSGASHPGGLARAGLDCRLPPFWREDGRRRTRGHPAADQSHASRSWRATKVSAGRAVIHEQQPFCLRACLVSGDALFKSGTHPSV